MPTLRSQAHLQVAPANAKTKTCKKACLPKRTADRKDAAKMKDKLTGKINNETLTRYIKNWADSAENKACSSHLTLCGLTGNRSEMPNFSYTHPLGSHCPPF